MLQVTLLSNSYAGLNYCCSQTAHRQHSAVEIRGLTSLFFWLISMYMYIYNSGGKQVLWKTLWWGAYSAPLYMTNVLISSWRMQNSCLISLCPSVSTFLLFNPLKSLIKNSCNHPFVLLIHALILSVAACETRGHCVAVCVLLCNLFFSFFCAIYIRVVWLSKGGGMEAVAWMKAGGTIYHSVSPLSSQNPRLFFF